MNRSIQIKYAFLFSVFIISMALTSGLSCFYYSFSGKSIPDVESVAIPLFTDKTLEFQLKDRLQLKLIETFQEENLFKIESADRADAILNGVIISVEDQLAAVDRQERAEQTELHITVEIKFENRTTGKVILNERVYGIGFYKSVPERSAAIDQAIEQLTREITDKMLSGW